MGIFELLGLSFYWREGLLLIAVAGSLACCYASLRNPVLKPITRWAVLLLSSVLILWSALNLN